jgi:hypothetical protein
VPRFKARRFKVAGQYCSCGRFTIDADHLQTAQRKLVCGTRAPRSCELQAFAPSATTSPPAAEGGAATPRSGMRTSRHGRAGRRARVAGGAAGPPAPGEAPERARSVAPARPAPGPGRPGARAPVRAPGARRAPTPGRRGSTWACVGAGRRRCHGGEGRHAPIQGAWEHALQADLDAHYDTFSLFSVLLCLSAIGVRGCLRSEDAVTDEEGVFRWLSDLFVRNLLQKRTYSTVREHILSALADLDVINRPYTRTYKECRNGASTSALFECDQNASGSRVPIDDVCICMCMYVCISMCMHVCMCMYVCTYVRMYLCMYVHCSDGVVY